MNRLKSLRRLLDSLDAQIFKDFEVVIVEGGDTDSTKALIKDYKMSIIFVKQTRNGLVNAVNEGWKNSNGEIIIRTDDDIIANPQWLLQIVNTFRTSKTIGGVTGPTIIPEEIKNSRDLFYFQKKMKTENIFWNLVRKIYFNYFLESKPLAVGKFLRSGAFSVGSNYASCLKLKEPVEVDHHEACNMAVRRDLLKRVEGFDSIFTGVGEYNEADVSFKIRKRGYKIVFNPKAVIYHLPSKAGVFGERSNSYSRMINFIHFYFRHIKPNTVDKFTRFSSYLLFLNGYYFYKFLTTRNFGYLQSIPGTFQGLLVNILRFNRVNKNEKRNG